MPRLLDSIREKGPVIAASAILCSLIIAGAVLWVLQLQSIDQLSLASRIPAKQVTPESLLLGFSPDASTMLRGLMPETTGILLQSENDSVGSMRFDERTASGAERGSILRLPHGNVLSLTMLDAASTLHTMRRKMVASDALLTEGIEGILRTNVRGIPSSVLQSLLRHPLSIAVSEGSGGTLRFLLAGSVDTPEDLQPLHDVLQRSNEVTIRTMFLMEENMRIDALTNRNITDSEEGEIIDGWAVTTASGATTEPHSLLSIAQRGEDMVISNDAMMLRHALNEGIMRVSSQSNITLAMELTPVLREVGESFPFLKNDLRKLRDDLLKNSEDDLRITFERHGKTDVLSWKRMHVEPSGESEVPADNRL